MSIAIPRSKWGARYGLYSRGIVQRGEVVVHITVNTEIPASASQAVEEAAMRGVERYVVQQRRFFGYPYNFCGFQSGRIYEGQGWRNGQHTQRGRNRSAYAIARFGHPDVAPSPAFLAAARAVCAEGLAGGLLTRLFRLSGHRDHWDKACPGDPLYEAREQIRPGTADIEEDDIMDRNSPPGGEIAVMQWRINTVLHGEPDPRGQGKNFGLVVDGKFGPETEKYVNHVKAGWGYTHHPGKADPPFLDRLDWVAAQVTAEAA